MITWNELENCLAEADRFTKKALAAQERLKELNEGRALKDWRKYPTLFASRETAAVRRASMDLTRSLAKLRERV